MAGWAVNPVDGCLMALRVVPYDSIDTYRKILYRLRENDRNNN
jgi:hypothetical protein